MKYYSFILALSFLAFTSCSDDDGPAVMTGEPTVNNPVDPNRWDVPQDEVFSGGPGKDGIPSIDEPKFSRSEALIDKYLNQLVLGVAGDGFAKAYPHPILDWHEIVNDKVGDQFVALTYCPLTGTGIGWNRTINNTLTEFGVSGLLYNTNLMPYDRATNSTWSQQRLDCVNGQLVGSKIETVTFVETTLRTWLEFYPESDVLSEDTGFNRNYGAYPYGDYRTNNSRLLFPISDEDDRLNAKERVLGVYSSNDNVKGYQFNDANAGTDVIMDKFEGQDLVVVRNAADNFIVAFLNPDELSFESVNDNSNAIVKDNQGNQYDLTGQVIQGSGKDLVLAKSYIGYWFSWGTFYPGLELYEN